MVLNKLVEAHTVWIEDEGRLYKLISVKFGSGRIVGKKVMIGKVEDFGRVV